MTFETNSWPANGGTAGGVSNNYGPRTTDGRFGGSENSGNIIRRALWDFNFDGLPVGSTSGLGFVIPANSTIVSARLYIDTAFTSTSTTTTLLIGLEQADGTDIDVDGLVAAAQGSAAAIAVADSNIVGAGALVGKTIGAAAGELIVAGSANDLLTGHARLVVEYVLNS